MPRTDTAPSTHPVARPLARPLRLLLLVWAPFVTIFAFASPAVVDVFGDSHPHIVFHVLAALLLVVAVLQLRRWRPEATTRVQRAASAVLLVTLPLAVVGNLAELVTAVARLADDGWESRLTPDLFETGAHATVAGVTIPAMMLSMLTVTVLVVAVAFQRPAARETGRA